MKNNLIEKRQFNLKDVCIIYVLSILIYLILSLVVSTILDMQIPAEITQQVERSTYFAKRTWYPIVSFGVFPISFISVLLIYGKVKNLSYKIIIKENKISYLDLTFTILLTLGMCFGFSLLNNYFINFIEKISNYEPQNIILPDFSLPNFIVSFIFVCVLPAICEELMFRKLFIKSMQGANLIFTMLFVGLLFSLFHFNLVQTLYQFVIGCLFVIVVKATNSTIPAVLIHFLNNLIVLILYYINENLVIPLFVVIIGLVVAIISISYFIYKLIKNKQEKTLKVKDCLIVLLPLAFTLVIWVMVL